MYHHTGTICTPAHFLMHACARDQSELLCGIQIGKTRKRSCKNTRTCALEPDLSLCFCIVQSQPTKSMLCLPHALEGTKYIMEFKEISKSSKTFKTDVSSQVHGVLSKDACNSRRTGLVVERSQLGANPPPAVSITTLRSLPLPPQSSIIPYI